MFVSLNSVRSFSRIAVMCIVAASVSLSAAAASWKTYHNTRFGATADVPSDWKMGRPPQNNDGRSFLAPDGVGVIIISGIFSVSPHEEEIADRLKPNDGETITKSSSDATHVRVEGTHDSDGFVRVSILSCQGKIWNDLDITYPQKDAAKYRAAIDHAVATFRPGKGYDMDCK